MTTGFVPAESDDPAKHGDLVGDKYIIDGVLGRGASGVVFAATKQGAGGTVALKVIHRELCHKRQIFGRYRREASILRSLGNDHIVRFLDFFEHDGLLTIALERVAGTSLEELMREPVPRDEAVDIMAQVCRGLAVAHAAGVVHRDLKPANIMVEKKNGAVIARILDFGLAKVVHGEHLVTGLTERDMIFGTPEYMAPEQARGDDVDARCDIYACGVMLYELCTGSVPLRGKSPLATMTAQLTEAIEPPRVRAPGRDIPAALETVIMRSLEKEPDRRYRSAQELENALLASIERRVISVQPRDDREVEAEIDGDVGARDTELMLRRSQIQNAQSLLADAERLLEDRKKAKAAHTPLSRPREATDSGWLWPAVAGVAIAACVVLGVLLALK